MCRVLAVENRLVETSTREDTLVAPLALVWKGALFALRNFVGDNSPPVVRIIHALKKNLTAIVSTPFEDMDCQQSI